MSSIVAKRRLPDLELCLHLSLSKARKRIRTDGQNTSDVHISKSQTAGTVCATAFRLRSALNLRSGDMHDLGVHVMPGHTSLSEYSPILSRQAPIPGNTLRSGYALLSLCTPTSECTPAPPDTPRHPSFPGHSQDAARCQSTHLRCKHDNIEDVPIRGNIGCGRNLTNLQIKEQLAVSSHSNHRGLLVCNIGRQKLSIAIWW